MEWVRKLVYCWLKMRTPEEWDLAMRKHSEWALAESRRSQHEALTVWANQIHEHENRQSTQRLRQSFAGASLAGYRSRFNPEDEGGGPGEVAEKAWRDADAMMRHVEGA